ncbi:unnamed protein product [Linum trigynum]|uniref:Uncharacterized protein n=1 Tax=Linum trigynum TaxID=586398 RepID=A0AAV2D8D1_9ROSI
MPSPKKKMPSLEKSQSKSFVWKLLSIGKMTATTCFTKPRSVVHLPAKKRLNRRASSGNRGQSKGEGEEKYVGGDMLHKAQKHPLSPSQWRTSPKRRLEGVDLSGAW